MHTRERHRPSSTGHLIHRLLPGSQLHFWRADTPTAVGPIAGKRPEFWILHPRGDPAPAGVAPEQLQVLLLDGAWSEATAMAKSQSGTGRLVSLPMTGESRFWLRRQPEDGRGSTIEALMFLLQALGLQAVHDQLRLQFELHVYAHLRARGQKEEAAVFLQDSPLRTAFPELLARLNERRPLEG